MQMSVVAALMIVTTILLSACEQQTVASVEERGTNYYGRGQMEVPGATQQAAFVEPIATNDLTPPATMTAAPVIASSPAPMAGTPFTTGTPAPAAPVAIASLEAAPNLTLNHPPSPAFATAQAGAWSWPVQGKVVRSFGAQSEGIVNEGITIAAADGTPIRAASAGEVAYVGTNVPQYGNLVIIRHEAGALTSYAHAREILVSKGDRVIQGDVLGYVGQTGEAKTPQLHFAMRDANQAVDPLSKLPSQMASR